MTHDNTTSKARALKRAAVSRSKSYKLIHPKPEPDVGIRPPEAGMDGSAEQPYQVPSSDEGADHNLRSGIQEGNGKQVSASLVHPDSTLDGGSQKDPTARIKDPLSHHKVRNVQEENTKAGSALKSNMMHVPGQIRGRLAASTNRASEVNVGGNEKSGPARRSVANRAAGSLDGKPAVSAYQHQLLTGSSSPARPFSALSASSKSTPDGAPVSFSGRRESHDSQTPKQPTQTGRISSVPSVTGSVSSLASEASASSASPAKRRRVFHVSAAEFASLRSASLDNINRQLLREEVKRDISEGIMSCLCRISEEYDDERRYFLRELAPLVEGLIIEMELCREAYFLSKVAVVEEKPKH